MARAFHALTIPLREEAGAGSLARPLLGLAIARERWWFVLPDPSTNGSLGLPLADDTNQMLQEAARATPKDDSLRFSWLPHAYDTNKFLQEAAQTKAQRYHSKYSLLGHLSKARV